MKTDPKTRWMDTGLLILRVGIGIAFICHGFPKIKAGPEGWEELGGAMGTFGITFAPTFWGFMAALAEFGGGLCLVAGLFARPAAFFLFCTMAVALAKHLAKGDGFNGYSHPLESAILFLSLIVTGPGRYTLCHLIRVQCPRKHPAGEAPDA